jgi:ribosomal protein S18 acetylase RimI-like enzyme
MANTKVKIRKATLKDLPEIIRVEKEAWPEGTEASEEMFRSRIETYPDGVFVALHKKKIIGVVAFMLIDYDLENPIPTWNEVTDNGMIKGTHDPNAETIFGIDLTAAPDAPRGTGTRLLMEVGRQAISKNLKRGVLGGRLPEYKKYADQMTPEEYINAKNENGEPLDMEVRFYKRAGLKIEKILPNYFDDPDSLDFGVMLVWENPFYTKKKFLKPFKSLIGRILFPIYFRSLS